MHLSGLTHTFQKKGIYAQTHTHFNDLFGCFLCSSSTNYISGTWGSFCDQRSLPLRVKSTFSTHVLNKPDTHTHILTIFELFSLFVDELYNCVGKFL